LVPGGSLADRLERGPLTPHEAVWIGRGVLAALRAAHAAGILHRDVKPANVLLRADGSPVLTDFGIAALHESVGLTATGSVVGSPQYVAPERIRGAEGDPASDLWSLAMTLYVALEGHNPLRRDTMMATLAAVLDAPIPPPTRAGPLAPVLSAMLVRDPAARPDAAQFDRMLAEAGYLLANPAPMPGGPAGCYPPPADVRPAWTPRVPQPPVPQPPVAQAPGRQRAAGRRSRALIAGAVAVALLGVVGAVVWALHGSPGTSAHGRTGTAGGLPSLGAPGVGLSPVTIPPTFGMGTQGGLLTPASVQAAITAFRPLIGGTKFIELSVFTNLIQAEAPTKDDRGVYDTYVYRGGSTATDWSAGSTVKADDLFDPTAIDWSKLPELLQKAATQLGIAKPTSMYVVAIGRVSGTAPALLVFAEDSYGNAHLLANASGKVVQTYPRTPPPTP
jgi:eukaryotic-like serine/threonine-protein kinase